MGVDLRNELGLLLGKELYDKAKKAGERRMGLSINVGLGALLAVGVYLQFIDFWIAIGLYIVLEAAFALFGKFILSKVAKKIERDVSENKDFLFKKYGEKTVDDD